MFRSRPPRPAPRSAAALPLAIAACCALLAACGSAGAPTSLGGSSAAPTTPTGTTADPSATASSPASQTAGNAAGPTAGTGTVASTEASASSNPNPPGPSTEPGSSDCATAKGYPPLVDASITVCPDATPVGGVVHVTIDNCATTDLGGPQPDIAAAELNFLGPGSWLGTNGGGGALVRFTPAQGSVRATAAFTIPATYQGGNENGPYPTVKTKPGTGYTFTTDPAGGCTIHFTVTGS